VIRAHQPGSEPIDIPETIPNPVVVPKPVPAPTEPAPKEPVRTPEKVPQNVFVPAKAGAFFFTNSPTKHVRTSSSRRSLIRSGTVAAKIELALTTFPSRPQPTPAARTAARAARAGGSVHRLPTRQLHVGGRDQFAPQPTPLGLRKIGLRLGKAGRAPPLRSQWRFRRRARSLDRASASNSGGGFFDHIGAAPGAHDDATSGQFADPALTTLAQLPRARASEARQIGRTGGFFFVISFLFFRQASPQPGRLRHQPIATSTPYLTVWVVSAPRARESCRESSLTFRAAAQAAAGPACSFYALH
jgi:hypothetical protein